MAYTRTAPSSEKPSAQTKVYDNTNRGVLFANDKDGNDSRPDFTGKINVDGVEKRLAAWTQFSDKVGEFLSIRVSEIEDSR